MALFKRGGDPTVPGEVRDYYEAERRDRRGLAWLLGLGTALVTVALAVGLFFGGRAAWRAVFDNDKKQPVATAPSPTPQAKPANPQPTPNLSTPSPAPTPPPPPAPAPVPAPRPTPPTQSAPAPGTQAQNLADTGAGNTIALFVTVAVTAGAGHYALTRKQTAS
jgi:hypothetical protein